MRRWLMSFSVRCLERPLALDQVHLCVSNRYNRLVHPDPSIEGQKAQSWNELERQTPNLFNALKFRLHTLLEDKESTTLRMKWGLTDYASYVGTCCSSLAPRLLEDGKKLHNDPFAFFSRKVGVAAVLETRDGHVVLLKRSKRVGLYPDLYDTPGGHPEPVNIQLTEELLQAAEDGGDESKKTQLENAAKHEFFQSIANEVYEEVNLPLQQQQPPRLLGVVLQSDACTPSFAFHIQTECSAEDVHELYRAGPPDAFESVKLQLLSAENLLAKESTLLHELKLTPSAMGTLDLWKHHTLRSRQQELLGPK